MCTLGAMGGGRRARSFGAEDGERRWEPTAVGRREFAVGGPPAPGRGRASVRFLSRSALSLGASARRPWKSLARLGGAPARLWAVFGMKFLESFGYFSLALVLTQFLTAEVGMDDTGAGLAYGLYGTLVTLFAVPSGLLCDTVGLRAALLLGAAVTLAGRVSFALVRTETAALLILFLVLPIGTALGIPVLGQAVRQHTNPGNRAVGFAVYYAVMAAGQVAAGLTRDLCVLLVGPEPRGLSGYRVLLLVGAGTTLAFALVAPWVIDGDEGNESGGGTTRRGVWRRRRRQQVGALPSLPSGAPGQGLEVHPCPSPSLASPSASPLGPGSTTVPLLPPGTSLRRVVRERDFWRLMLLLFASLFVKMIFRHMDATFPKYMARQFSDMTPTGSLYALNPLLVLFLVPLVTALTSHLPGLWVVIAGAWTSVLSLFFLTFGNHIALVVLFVVTLSIGESLWSPRLYEYASNVAPRGQEGVYGSLSAAPLFLAKLPTGALSGALVATFLPEDGSRKQGQALWAVIGAISLTGPLIMTAFRWTIVKPGFEAYLDGARALPGLGAATGLSPRVAAATATGVGCIERILVPADADGEGASVKGAEAAASTKKLAESFAAAGDADAEGTLARGRPLRRTQSAVGFLDGVSPGQIRGLRRSYSCPGRASLEAFPAVALGGSHGREGDPPRTPAEAVRTAQCGSYIYNVVDAPSPFTPDHTIVTLSAVAAAVQQPVADPTWLARILSDLDRAEATGHLQAVESYR